MQRVNPTSVYSVTRGNGNGSPPQGEEKFLPARPLRVAKGWFRRKRLDHPRPLLAGPAHPRIPQKAEFPEEKQRCDWSKYERK